MTAAPAGLLATARLTGMTAGAVLAGALFRRDLRGAEVASLAAGTGPAAAVLSLLRRREGQTCGEAFRSDRGDVADGGGEPA